jgi:transcriptional regulator with XRE-family HTH domain
LSFGARLRAERERRNISIASIAEDTKILGALLEGLENDDVTRWPTGLYRRSFMRAYATAIGLDPKPIVKEFVEKFPEPEETPAVPVAAPAPSTALPALPASASRHAGAAAPQAAAGEASWFADGALVANFWLRCFAAAVDLFVLSVMGLVLFVVLGMFWAPLCLAMAAYYAGSILLLGNTPGVCLFADPQRRVRVYVAASSFVGVFR